MTKEIGSPPILVHYGAHAGTTGSHFGAAAKLAPTRYMVRACSSGSHLLLSRQALDGYIWIESGVSSYPLDAHAPPFPTCGYLIDVHLHLATSLLQAALFDTVFVAQKDYVDSIRSVNPRTEWLPLASPSSFLAGDREPRFDIGFVGQARPGSAREATLRALNALYGMNDWRRAHTVDEMGAVYRRSRIVVNQPANGDVNMRFFEAMGCGAVVVSPQLGNGLDDLAKEGEHYVAADFNLPALLESVAVLLNSAHLGGIGEQARALVARNHTYEHRLQTMSETLASGVMDAPVRAMSPRQRSRHLASLAESIADEPLARHALRVCGFPDARTGFLAAKAVAKSRKRRFRGRRFSRPPI